MGTVQRKLFLWAGIFSIISFVAVCIFLILANFAFSVEYSRLLNYLQNELGLMTNVSGIKRYFNTAIVSSGLVNAYLSVKYITYSKMTIKELSRRGNSILIDLIVNAFFGGNFVSLVLTVVAVAKPIEASFSDKMIKQIDSESLEKSPNAISKIIKIKQDKLNGIIGEKEFKDKINKVLEEEARRFL